MFRQMILQTRDRKPLTIARKYGGKQEFPPDVGYQNSITYLLGHLADQIRRLRIERNQIHPDIPTTEVK
jgi:hypothetical protein